MKNITELKRKKPNFLRQDAHKVKRLEQKWRRPKGMHNKMKFGYKGHRVRPSIGYGSPSSIKGLNKSGLLEKLVYNIVDLEKINPEQESAVISSNVGLKKKFIMLEKAKQLKIKVSNIPDIDKFMESIKKKKEEKKKQKESKEEIKKEEKTEQKEVKEEVKKEQKPKPKSKNIKGIKK